MWEVLKKVKGIPLDQDDQALNDMIRRTLEDEIIPFDEWQDLVDGMEDDNGDIPDIEALLQKYGVTRSELPGRAEAARKEFLDTLRRYGLPVENRLKLCQNIYEKASTEPSAELLRLYCDIVCDGGFLMDIERAGDDGAVCWLLGKEDADALYGYLSERAKQNLRFRRILEQAREINLSALGTGAEVSNCADEIFQTYVQIFRPIKNHEKLLGNIAQLLQIADHAEKLTPIKPLFLYRMLTRHGKRLQTSEALKVDFHALWNYQEYNFEQDNGKNYRTNVCYLELFSKLCDIFQADKTVDIPLCVCGFDRLSNLSEFYRENTPKDFEIPFAPPVEDLLDESLFSCFENGYEDNVVMVSSGISSKALGQFQCSTDRNRYRALARISDYMNSNVTDLVAKFWGASPEDVKTLCAEILEASALPGPQQPKTAQDTSLFLASINGGLMDAVDGFAMQYLAAAGTLLICE